MIFTFPALSRSLADCLAPDLPGVRFFAGPTQQGAKPPMLFLRQTHASISPQTGDRFLRKLGLDLVYLEQFNRLGAGPATGGIPLPERPRRGAGPSADL